MALVADSVKNMMSIPDLRKRIFYTLALLAVYRIGATIPTPGVDPQAMEQFFKGAQGSVLGFLDLFSGGAFRRVSIFSLGIMPYISASIILQLLTVVWPYLEKLSKEGELGRRKITQYTRYLTVVLALVQSFGIALTLESMSPSGMRLVENPGMAFRLLTMITLTTGTAFLMWLGEQITERGIGNGISLIIFAGIVVALPSGIFQVIINLQHKTMGMLTILLLAAFMVVVVAVIIYVERAQRRIPIQYPKRVMGRRVVGGTTNHLPLRVNTGGVIPVIFASSILAFPQTLKYFTGSKVVDSIVTQLSYGMPLYNLMYVGLIIFFCYFYTAIVFNPTNVADEIKKHGGYVPGIRPGKRTADFIERILTRITLVGALYLALIAILPEFLTQGFKVEPIPWIGPKLNDILPQWITRGLNVPFYFGGTSLLIVVGVGMDTLQQVESQLIMRHYEGFVKKGRIRGRRG
ncbi:preprotein translocase subunit SecY [bacterium]|nr:preprotein translocase subunit SecY [bacterium]MCI0606043.1 preprotein translocase subunit SecY [bacterium]